MKKTRLFSLVLVALLITSSLVFASNSNLNIFVNGEKVEFTSKPELINGKTFAPVREIYESFGGKVTWDNETKSVYVDVDQAVGQQKVPKNVIVMVGDGLGLGQMEVARLFEHGREGRLFMQSLPNVALMQTYSADNNVTDSGAAATALATGVKTNNKSIGIDAEGNEVTSITDLFQNAGKEIGMISTNTVFDATPAGFSASTSSRSASAEIARQLLDSDYDVILGGGAKYFGPGKQDGVDLVEKFKEKGYAFASDKNELAEIKDADKILGLFHDSYMNYIADRDDYGSEEPSLVEMTEKGLEILSENENGFFMMVEGARIDHAAHAADVTGVWKETIDFDNTVEKVIEWAKKDGETLVIVLGDHETMGFAASEPMDIEGLKSVEVSGEYMALQLVKNEEGNGYTPESIKEVLKTYANIELTDEQVAELNKNVLKSDGTLVYPHEVGWEIGSIVADHYDAGVMSRDIRKKGNTGGHSGNMVPVFSYGVGAEIFEGILDNTDIPKIIADIMNYEW